MVAFASETALIFGNLSDNFVFNKISTVTLPFKVYGYWELMEFKFIDENHIFICSEGRCCLYPILKSGIQGGFCILEKRKSREIILRLLTVNIQSGNNVFFTRSVHQNGNISIHSYSFNQSELVSNGESIDDKKSIQRLDTVYSFAHGNHVYFIDRVVRSDFATNLLNRESNISRINTDIVLTQICNNDKSLKISSRMDLILSCEGTWYNDSKVAINNYITAALYMSDTNTLLVAVKTNETIFCKFNMAEIENEFQKTWNFCQNFTRSFTNCDNITNYKEFAKAGCLKHEFYEDNSFLCKTDQNESFSNSCDIGIKGQERIGYNNYEPIYGKLFSSSFLNKINKYGINYVSSFLIGKRNNVTTFVEADALFQSSKNGNEIFVLTSTAKLIKVLLYSSNISIISTFDFNPYLHNFGFRYGNYQRFVVQWKEKDGFIFLGPINLAIVQFKNTTCSKEVRECNEIYLSLFSYTCGKCSNASVSAKSCNLEMQTICSPMWYKGNAYYYEYWTEYDDRNSSKIVHCSKASSKNEKNCSQSLNDYLKPYFILPHIFVNNEFSNNTFLSWKKLLIPFCLLFITASIFTGIYFYYKNKKISKMQNDLTNADLKEFNKRYLIAGKNVVLIKLLGSGNTSDVYLANFIDNSSPIKVAVKTLKINAKKADILKEIKLLSLCKHSNIVSFIGWIDQEPHTCIITEFMGGGDLHVYLKEPKNLLTMTKVFLYIFQILNGMIYLSQQKILHRDLAARNCLLNETYEILKINDFGLSRKMNFNYQYISDADPHLPFKWLPLEALEPSTTQHKIFTSKGDIWSFGILLWEIFERGNEPYDGMNYHTLLKFLKTGNRLQQPRNCPIEIYEIMLWCWEKNPEDRPKFVVIENKIKDLYKENKILSSDFFDNSNESNLMAEIINKNYV